MKFLFSISLLIFFPIVVMSITRTVAIDGTQQYMTIQSAITASVNGDIVLVYPGTYIENVNTIGKSITLASRYSQNPLQTYIDNTIINGNLSSSLKISQGETVTVNGFTLINNPQHLLQNPVAILGGGLYVKNNSHVYLQNCIIRDCMAYYGGGVYAGYNAIVEFSNAKIFSNQALYFGGGLALTNSGQLLWNNQQSSSIYNNVAPVGMDVLVTDCVNQININLRIGSKAMNAPDSFFVLCYDNDVAATVTIAQSYFNFTNHDIYVSPDGNDDNDGLTFATSMKTIKHALQVIQPSPDSTLTIYLAPGTYSNTSNGELLPLSLKSNVRIIGSGTDCTIINGELIRAFFCGYCANNVCVSDISFINGKAASTNPLEFVHANDIALKNLVISNTHCMNSSGVFCASTNNIICENLDLGNSTQANFIATFYANECNNVYLNKIVSHNNTITSADYFQLGIFLDECDVVLRNTIIANNSAHDAYLLSYQNVYEQNAANNLDMSNVLITNNNITQCSMAFNPLYLQNRFQRIQVNNCTFAGNSGSSGFSSIFAYADVRNTIFYNPQSPYELYLRNNITSAGIQADVTLSNNLFRTATIGSDLPNLVTNVNNIFNGNPLFLGYLNDSLDVTQSEYYYLSASSPCINTGTADTTGLNLPSTDLAGNQRVWNGRIDMGCYEYRAPVANEDQISPILPDKIILSIYPNPVLVNGSKGGYAFIEFTLPEKAKEQPVIDIYNLKGQKVRSITLTQSYNDMIRKAGLSKSFNKNGEFYSTVFDCKDSKGQKLSSGIYIIRVAADNLMTTGKMTILK